MQNALITPNIFEDIPRDTLKDNDYVELMKKRKTVAQTAFENADLSPIEGYGSWNEDGIYFSRSVYWESEETSILGSFGVQFVPDSTIIVDTWTN